MYAIERMLEEESDLTTFIVWGWRILYNDAVCLMNGNVISFKWLW